MTPRKRVALSRFGLLLPLLCVWIAAMAVAPVDHDGDGMSVDYETFFGLNDGDPSDAAADPDGDGVVNLLEYRQWSDPHVADTDHDGWGDAVDRQPVSRAVLDWGLPQYTTGNEFRYPGPAWWLGARKEDGEWITPQQLNGEKNGQTWEFLDAFLAAGFSNGWNVAANRQADTGRLIFSLDRSRLTNNVVLQATFLDTPGATVHIDVLASSGEVLASDIAGNLLAGHGGARTVTQSVNLVAYPMATAIALRRGVGDVTVVRSILYVDEDGDGLDDGQEAQVGTSDYSADTDNDGIRDPDELARGTSPTTSDSDGDGLADGAEVGTYHTDPLNPDSDGDGLTDGAEVNVHHTDPLQIDTDGDGLTDRAEIVTHHTDPLNPDSDGDGLTDGAEVNTHHTDPRAADTDGDGLSDGEEVDTYHSNPLLADTDGDGLSDGDEIRRGTNLLLADSDGDGLTDGVEISIQGTDPLNPDTDRDGLSDGAEIENGTDPLDADSDDDGLTDGAEVNVHHSDPLAVDTDGDGLPDGEEVFLHHTDPAAADTDRDGLSDWDELFFYGTDPADADTDRDGMPDGWEIYYEFNPLHAADGVPASIGEYGTLDIVQTNALEWRAVSFRRAFRDPVVVVGPLTFNGTDPSMMRIRNVTPQGFEIKVDEWDYLDGRHTWLESFGYLAVEKGSHTLSDGRLLSAGAGPLNDLWHSFRFDRPFPETPVVLATPQTYDDNLAIRSNLTIAAWVKPEQFNSWAGVLVRGSDKAPYGLAVADTGALRFSANQFSPYGAVGSGSWVSSGRLSLGAWQHIAVTYDGQRVRFYLDGVRDANTPQTSLVLGVVKDSIVLGCDFPGDDGYFHGAMQDVRLYGRALTDGEVAALAEPPSPPIGWWPLREGAGTNVVDYIGEGSGVFFKDMKWTTDSGGSAVAFPGAAGRIVVDNASGLNVSNRLTLAAWIRPDRFNSWAGLITKGVNKAPYSLTLWNDGSLRFIANQYEPDGYQGNGGWNSSNKLAMGRWQHVAATYDGAKIRFYIDGQKDPREVSKVLRFGRTDEALILGCDMPGGDEYFKGAMRDARIYDRPLSDAEIAALAALPEDLAAWWPLQEREGPVRDISGHENHGTATNGIGWVEGPGGPAMAFDGAGTCVRAGQTKYQAVTVRLTGAERGGVQARLQEQEANDGTHHMETLGWVAIESGEGPAMKAAVTPAAVTHEPYQVLFGAPLAETPVFLGQAQTTNGMDPIVLRQLSAEAGSVTFRLQEETSKDSETQHTNPERVGYVALTGPGGEVMAAPDADGDGVSNVGEFLRGSDPHDGDNDLDGMTDEEEYLHGTNPRRLDSDGDGLPDSWEVLYGFDPTNRPNYDADGDGLSNLEEYNLGTDPWKIDSDGDGLDDRLEVRGLLSDPLRSNDWAVAFEIVRNGCDATGVTGTWTNRDTSLVALDCRGSARVEADLPRAGIYRVVIVAGAGQLWSRTNEIPVRVCLDGRFLFRRTFVTFGNSPGTLQFMSPFLSAGVHRLDIEWRDAGDAFEPALHQVRWQILADTDGDGNGLEDWMDTWMAAVNGFDTPATSLVSPACIEGRDESGLPVLDVEGEGIEVQGGVGARWFANLPLSPASAVALTATFDNGAYVQTRDVTWAPLNLLVADPPILRVGDALRLTAAPEGVAEGEVAIEIVGKTGMVTQVASPLPVTFGEPGTFALIASHTLAGQTTIRTSSVQVISAEFNGSPAVWVGRSRTWLNPDLPAAAFVEPDPALLWTEVAPSGGVGRAFSVGVEVPESYRVLARTAPGGAIAAAADVEGIQVLSSVETYVRKIETLPDGSSVYETAIVADALPADVVLRFNIFVGGVVFEDGTTVRELTAADFSDTGVYILRFVKADGVKSSICHRLYIYEDGQLIGKR